MNLLYFPPYISHRPRTGHAEYVLNVVSGVVGVNMGEKGGVLYVNRLS